MRWGRILATGLVLPCLVVAFLVGSPRQSRAEPESGPLLFPARLATEIEQRDMLRVLLLGRYLGRGLHPPGESDLPRMPGGSRPILTTKTSLRFCPPLATPEAIDPDCASDGMEAAIASPRWDTRGAPNIPHAFRAALVDANRQAHPQPLPGGRASAVMASDEIPRTFQLDFWKRFYERHPGSAGYFQATRAVVSGDGRQALIYVEHSCGGLCGSGDLHLLRFRDGQWRVETSYMLWIS